MGGRLAAPPAATRLEEAETNPTNAIAFCIILRACNEFMESESLIYIFFPILISEKKRLWSFKPGKGEGSLKAFQRSLFRRGKGGF